MSVFRPLLLVGQVTILWAMLAAILLLPGRLMISGIEADVLHALDGALRVQAGALPHLDFPTPLGLIAFGLPALGLAQGLGPGMALIAANLAVAAFLLPMLVWLGVTRLSPWTALVVSVWALAEAGGLVHDSTVATTTFALFYNRWGWAVFTCLALLMLVPARTARTASGDGLMLGAGLAFLALLKMTYFLALALPVLVWLVAGRRWHALAVATLTGLAVMAAVTVRAGPGIWPAYLGDLIMVANSDIRPRPGLSLAEIVASPAYVLGSFALLGGIIALRLAGLRGPGLQLLMLLPGAIYVTYQNWANAPVWLVTLAVALHEARGRMDSGARILALPARGVLGGLALVALTQVGPHAINMLASPLRHLGADPADYLDPFDRPGWDDLMFLKERAAMAMAQVPVILPEEPPSDPRSAAEILPVTFMGRSFPACTSTSGLIAQYRERARALAALPDLDPDRVLTADLVNATWAMAGGNPLPGASPWYYGGRAGFDAADWILVPACPFGAQARQLILSELAATGWAFRERWSGEVGTIYERIR